MLKEQGLMEIRILHKGSAYGVGPTQPIEMLVCSGPTPKYRLSDPEILCERKR